VTRREPFWSRALTHLVPVSALLHPLANPLLGILKLVVVRGVDEVAW